MDKMELLFFDTFMHDGAKEINMDLIKFKKPVHIMEIRIIPLGGKVKDQFPGGHIRLGATNLSKFTVEFFVHDVSDPEADVFELLGKLEFDESRCINLETQTKDMLTDSLILKGCYDTITLAVYGLHEKPELHKPPSPVSVIKSASDHEVATAECAQQQAQVTCARAG